MPELEMSNIAQRRAELGLSRERLARQADTSTSTITRMEREGHIPNGATVARIAGILGIPIEALLSPSNGDAAPHGGLS